MIIQALEMNQENPKAYYQMIKDEHLSFQVMANLHYAGSRVLMSTYQHVVFSDCVFYSMEFQGVTFENCVFSNCNFNFTHIRNCRFINCNFENCNFKASSTQLTQFLNCDLDAYLSNMTGINHNYYELAIAG